MKKLFTLIVAMFAFANIAKATPSYCLTFVNSEIKAEAHGTQVFYRLPTPLVKDKNYTLTMRVYFENPFDKGLPFWPYKNGGKTQYTGFNKSSFNAGEWTNVECQFTAIDDHEFLQFPIGYVNGTMRIDDIVLVEDGTTTNLVNNGSFEDKVDYTSYWSYESMPDNVTWWSWNWAKPIVSWEIYPSPFILGVSGGPLTQDMFHQWNGVDANAEIVGNGNGDYKLNNSTGLAYGHGSVLYDCYADLSAYSKLIVTASAGEPRFIFNREAHPENKGNIPFEYPQDKDKEGKKFETVVDNGDGTKSYIIDLKSITAVSGYAHLNCIKGANWANVTVTSMELIPDGKAVDGYRHFSCNKALDFSTVRDIEAYIVPECEDGKVYMKKVTGVVPANTGLILKDVTGASSVTIPTVDRFDSTLVNLLVPVADATEINKAEKGNNYLYDGTKWVAVSAPTAVPAGSCYLPVNSSLVSLVVTDSPISVGDSGFIEVEGSPYDPDKAPEGGIESATRPDHGMVDAPSDTTENNQQNGTATGINSAEAGSEIVSIVTANGARVNTLQKGINIVTYSNGKRVKVIK